MKYAASALAALLLAAGCGGSSDQDKVRDTARQSIEAQLSDHPERACQYVVDHDACVSGVATARALKLDVAAIVGYPKDWRARLDHAKITVKGDTATMSAINGGGTPTRFIRRDGQWFADNR